MRAITLVQKIEFEFTGNIARNAITLGDVDNDGHNECIIGNDSGSLLILKGQKKFQTITNLSFIGCVCVGDIMSQQCNMLVVITADGWCYLYALRGIKLSSSVKQEVKEKSAEQVEELVTPTSKLSFSDNSKSTLLGNSPSTHTEQTENDPLICIHTQRIPANAKSIIIADIDGDGTMEMVLGLTDRFVRSYRWTSNSSSDESLGMFVALNKWECANQIGSITLHHYFDGKLALLIAQPGGTFMRIKCYSEDLEDQVAAENPDDNATAGSSDEHFSGTIDYQFLGISRMRNPNISTEILGGFKSNDKSCGQGSSIDKPVKGEPYAIATLDGTIMLVQDEVIQWAFAVDHQVFALTKLDVTGNGSDDIVACTWDGQTYILDQQKNSVRFHLDEAVQAFDSGYYSIDGCSSDVTCFVYVTFKNTILVYYDIPLKELKCKKYEPDNELLGQLFTGEHTHEEPLEIIKKLDQRSKRDVTELLLYHINM